MITISDALVTYKTYARAEGKSPKTVAWAAFSAAYFSQFLGPDHQDVAAISGHDLRRFIVALQGMHRYSHHPFNKPLDSTLSPHAIDTYCRGVKNLFSFLCREGFIASDPLVKVRLPKLPEKIVPTFSEKEIGKLFAQPDKRSSEGFRDYTILLTLIDTGVRLSELANLKANDIDYEQNLFKVMGKGSKERYVPFGRKVARALMRYQMKCRPQPVGTDHFWLRKDGEPLSANRIQKLIKRYGNKAGLERCYPHKFRHSSAVMYLRNGGDVFTLQRKLGHRSLVMTRRYSNLADTDVRDVHLKYGVADRLKL